jgi:hypothetical protein
LQTGLDSSVNAFTFGRTGRYGESNSTPPDTNDTGPVAAEVTTFRGRFQLRSGVDVGIQPDLEVAARRASMGAGQRQDCNGV